MLRIIKQSNHSYPILFRGVISAGALAITALAVGVIGTLVALIAFHSTPFVFGFSALSGLSLMATAGVSLVVVSLLLVTRQAICANEFDTLSDIPLLSEDDEWLLPRKRPLKQNGEGCNCRLAGSIKGSEKIFSLMQQAIGEKRAYDDLFLFQYSNFKALANPFGDDGEFHLYSPKKNGKKVFCLLMMPSTDKSHASNTFRKQEYIFYEQIRSRNSHLRIKQFFKTRDRGCVGIYLTYKEMQFVTRRGQMPHRIKRIIQTPLSQIKIDIANGQKAQYLPKPEHMD